MEHARAYLDWNASAPLLPAAREAMLVGLDLTANASSVHAEGRAARALLEGARGHVASLVGADAQVLWTSCATEAASTLLTRHWSEGREPLSASHLFVCAADHPCTLNGGRFGAEAVSRLPVDASGLLDLDALEAALRRHDGSSGVPLVAVHAANNETGVIQPWGAVGAIVRASGGMLVLDAVQAVGRIPLDGVMEHADHVILSSHKIGGPKGAGAILSRPGTAMPLPLVTGGGQERGLRAGTENVPAIAGFGAAARECAGKVAGAAAVAALRDRFEGALGRAFPDAVVHGCRVARLPNTSLFTLPGIKAETAQIAFDLAGVALSAGSACSSGKVGPSHVLLAMGTQTPEGALRVSIGPETGEAELERFAAALEGFVRRRQLKTPSARAA